MFPGESEDLQNVGLCDRLKDEIRQALQHEVPDQRGEIRVEVAAVILKLLRIFYAL
jgi:hypothetical protein